MAETAPFVRMEHVTKRYPGILAVDDVSLSFNTGQVVGLVGKNGAGKSSVIKILAGLVKPDSGRIFVADEPASLSGPFEATQLGMAFVHQELELVPDLTVAENVYLGVGYPRRFGRSINWKQLRRQTEACLQQLGASVSATAHVERLSVAEKRLVMLARGLALNARLVVLDEPTASLSDREISDLFEVISRLRESGTGLVYVSHRLQEILQITDRVVVMRDGRVVADQPTASMTKTSLVAGITGEAKAEESQAVHLHRARSATDDELLRVEGLDRPPGVREASFVLRSGEILGVAGLVGSGRSELARVLFGIDRAVSGRMFLRGKEISAKSPKDALRNGITLLPEDRRHQGNITAFDIRTNITLPNLKAHRRVPLLPFPSARREHESSSKMIDKIGIATHGDSALVGSLSGGNQQKVMLAKWLLHGADVFIFDEPTHGIDVEGKADVYDLMGKLADEGGGVIFISSEFEELVAVCDRVLVIIEGRLVDEIGRGELSEETLLHSCYRGIQGAVAGVSAPADSGD